MRLLTFTLLTLLSFNSHAVKLPCDAERLGYDFGASRTIEFLQTAKKYQNFDFTSVKSVFEMQEVVKHKNALKDMYDMYQNSPFIWGETYQEMLPQCNEQQEKTLFAKAFTYYESRWSNNNNFDLNESMAFTQYLSEFDTAGYSKSRRFGVKSYEHLLAIFENAIQNIENNTATMQAAINGKLDDDKQELADLESEAKELDRLIFEQKAANAMKKKKHAAIAAKKEELDRLKKQSFDMSQSSNNQQGYPSSGNAGNRIILPKSVICFSKQAYDRQMQALAQNDHRLFSGCSMNKNAVRGWFDDISLFSGTCTMLSSDRNQKMWVNCERIKK